MSLDGAQLNFVNATGISVAHAAKGREFKVGSYLGCDLVLPDAERVHCEIKCDAFGRVSIYNHSRNEPILLNDQVVHATAKRPLLHGARIKILNEVYTWHFPKSEELGTPDRAPPEQAANSSPSLKGNRQRRQFDNRLTVHNFRYSINSDDEGNTSIESRELETSTSSNSADTSATAELDPSVTPPGKDADESEPKVDLLEATQNKENTSTLGNKLMLQLCARSDVVITSFSPRETGVKIEKSFTAVMKPTSGLGMTPKSVYNTPKSVLSELNDDSCSRDLPEFSTPSTSKKALAGQRSTSMYLVDLTTPQRLRPTLSVTPKQTPGSVEVISVKSTDESSDSSVLVIDITNSSTPATASAKQQQRRLMNTPAAGATPKRTPQSLMKRALLTSAKKQIAANSRTPTTPLDAATKRQSLLDARRQCLTAPRRLPFHPHPQWRTPGRRQIPAVDVKEPQTSPRKRPSLSLSNPRENKISKMRKTLAANAKISPNVGMSNKLVAKARRALNSPKQDSPKAHLSAYSPKRESPNRIGSPKLDSPKAEQQQDFQLIESSTPERAENSNAELSLTFTIDDEQNASSPVLEALIVAEDAADKRQRVFLDSILDENEPRQSKPTVTELKLNESSTKDSPTGSLKDAEACEENSKEIVNLVESTDEEKLNRTYDLNESPEKSNLELSTADIEQLSNSKAANESPVIDQNCAADDPTDSINKNSSNADAVHVIDDNICEEILATSTYQNDLVPIADVLPAEDTICAEVSTHEDTICEEVPTSEEDNFTNDIEDKPGFTPRRSRRLSAIEDKKKIEPSVKPTRRASTSVVVESQQQVAALVTPKRKRRLSEQLPTSSRKSQRLLSNTPKRALPVDESVGDMGVIVEEDAASADQLPTVTDEDYGTELSAKDADEPDKIDYHGMRELLKTPKSCSTPHFKGLREMIRTPKEHPSAMLDNIEELLGASTPKRSVTVSRVALELSKSETQDMYFKTPRGRNLMVPNDPASAVLKSIDKSLATTTEYDLNATNATMHLDKIFDDVLAVETTDPEITVEDSEHEINVTAISTAAVSEADPLSSSTASAEEPSETVRSEVLMNISHAETSHKDPLTSTAFKKGGEIDLREGDDDSYADGPKSPGICDVSGIQMLDRTTDSMFSEPLVVTGVDSCDVTLEETKPAEMVTKTTLEESSDTDSMVGLSEPLVLSDDEAEMEEAQQIEKSNTNDSLNSLNNKKEHKKEAEVSSVNEEKSIDLTEEKSTLDYTQDKLSSSKEQEEIVKSNANESIIAVKEGKNASKIVPHEEESIDLTEEEESTLDNTKEEFASSQNNEQDSELTASETSCNQVDSQIESEFAIDLESSCLNTTADDYSAQAEVTKSSTIYGADLSFTAQTQPADDSLNNASSNMQLKDKNEEDSIIELEASNVDNENSEIQLESNVSTGADKVEKDLQAQSVHLNPEETDGNKQTSDVPETDQQPTETLPEPKSDTHQMEVQEGAAVSTDEIIVQSESVPNNESINESQEKKTKSDKEASENGDVNEQSSHQIEVKASNKNVQLVNEVENENEAETISEASIATNDEPVLQIVTKTAESKEVKVDVELASESKSVLNASVVAEEEVAEQVPSQSEIEHKNQVDREANKIEEHIKEQAADENVIDLDAESDKEEEQLNEELPEITLKSLEKPSKKHENEIEGQDDVKATNVDDSLVELNTSVVQLENGDEHADKKLAEHLSTSGKSLNEPDEEIQSADLEATETSSTSAESETEANLESTNADVSLVELDASVVAENEKEEHLEQSAAETQPKSTEILSTEDKSEANLESTNADESLVELDASVVAETEQKEEHLEQSAAETLPKSTKISSTEDKTEANLKTTNADESLVEFDASVAAETNKEEHLDQEAAEILSASTEILSSQSEIEDQRKADTDLTNSEEFSVGASTAIETEKQIEKLIEEPATVISTSPEVLSNSNETVNKSQVEMESTKAAESTAQMDASVAAVDEKGDADLKSTNADEPFVEIDTSAVTQTEKKEENLSKEAAETLSTALVVPSNQNETVNISQLEVESKNEEKEEEHLEQSASEILSKSAELTSTEDKTESDVDRSFTQIDAAETEKGEANLKSTNTDESIAIETDKQGDLDESPIQTSSTLLEASANQDNNENVTQAGVKSTKMAGDVPETHKAEKLVKEQAADDFVINLDSETDEEEEQHYDRLPENITKSPEKSSNKLNDENKTEDNIEVTNVDDSLIELNASSEKRDEQLSVSAMPSTSAEKSLSEPLEEINPQVGEEATNVDDSLVVLDAVASKDEPANEQLNSSEIKSTSTENASEPKAKSLESTTANDSPIKQDVTSIAEADRSLVKLDKRDSASTSAEIQVPPNAYEAESRDKESSLTKESLDENGLKKAEHQESNYVSDVMEPSKQSEEPETEQKSDLNDSIAKDQDLNEHGVVAEQSTTAEIKKEVSGQAIDAQNDLSKTEKAPEVLSSKIKDNSAVIDLNTSSVVEIQSVEANLNEKNVALNTEEKQLTGLKAKINANILDEVQDNTDQTESSKAPEEDSESIEIVEPTTQIIENKAEDNNPAISMDTIPKKGRSRKSSTVEDTEATEIKLKKRTRKPSAALEVKETHIETEDHKPNNVHTAEKDVVAVSSHADKKLTAEIHLEKPKRRGRKPTVEVVEIDDKIKENVEQPIEIDEQEAPAENIDTEPPVEEKKEDHIDLGKPKQRRRNLAKVVETEEKVEEIEKKAVDLKKQKGRGRKPSVEVVEIEDDIVENVEQPIDLDTPEQQLQESPAEKVDTEAPEAEKKEDHIDLDKPKQRGRKQAKVVEAEAKVEEQVEKAAVVEIVENAEHADEKLKQKEDLDKSKRRGRGKPGAEVVETEAHVKESSDKTVELDKPRRRGQTPSRHVGETKTQSEAAAETTVELDKPKRRLRKPSAEVVETEKHDEEKSKPKRRGRIASEDVVEVAAHVAESKEDTIEPKRRGRKPSADVAKTAEQTEDTVEHDKPKRRLRKASVDVDVPSAESQEDSEHASHTEEGVEQIKEKPKRRYRKTSAEVEDSVETVEVPARKATRNARKASAETVESGKTSKETLSVIDEAAEPAEKKSRLEETAEVDATDEANQHGKQSPSVHVVPEQEPLAQTISAVVVKEVEPLSMPLQKIMEASDGRIKGSARRGRKATVDEEVPVIVEASTPHNKGSTRRGRKATVDEEAPVIVEAPISHKGSTRRGRKATTDEEAPVVVETTESDAKSATRRGRKATADEEASTAQPAEAAEMKPKRRGRNASADVAHAEVLTTAEKPTRRGRKPSADVAAVSEPPAEKKSTRRVLKPSKNVEITVEEQPQPKKTTARRGRKASLSAPADDESKQFDIQTLPIQPLETAAIVSVMVSPRPQVLSSEDELTPRRREGRNLPRKNYDETSDEDKHSGSSRKARKLINTKAAVTSPAKPTEPGASPLPKPSTPLPSKPVEPVVEVHTPVAPIVLPDPTSSQRREGRNMPRKNYSETSDDDKPSTSRGRRVRQPTIKALEQLVVEAAARPATPKRRAGKAKVAADDHAEEPVVKKVAVEEAEAAATPTPVKRGGRKTKIVEEVTDQQPAIKKPRGGARAKTPTIVEETKVHDEVEEPKEVPATKRALPARGRAARAVKVAGEAEIVQETAIPSRSGRGRKVHFETTEEVATTAAKEDQPPAASVEAPKRATRSRRK